MKKIKECLFISFIVFFTSISIVYGANTQVSIKTYATNVGNLYYEILYGNERITEDVFYTIKDASNNTVESNQTSNGILYKKNLPFGNYVIYIEGKKFPLQIDDHYILTQHILKPLEISTFIQTNTSDTNYIFPLAYLCMASFISIIYLKRKTPFSG